MTQTTNSCKIKASEILCGQTVFLISIYISSIEDTATCLQINSCDLGAVNRQLQLNKLCVRVIGFLDLDAFYTSAIEIF